MSKRLAGRCKFFVVVQFLGKIQVFAFLVDIYGLVPNFKLDFVGANLFRIIFDRTTSVGGASISVEREVVHPTLGRNIRPR